jgi:glucokinase
MRRYDASPCYPPAALTTEQTRQPVRAHGHVPVVEIGGSHVVAAMVDLGAGVVVPGSSHRADLDPAGSAEEILGTVIACSAALPAAPGERWGVALPGPFDYERGVGLFTGVAKFESLYGVDVGKALMGGLAGPPASVAFLNDAEAFAWGEWLFGAAAGYRRCVFLTLGTGIGSAFIADGTIRRSGPGVPPEGHAHLMQIDGRPLEDTVSTRAIERGYARRTGSAQAGVATIASLARAGDPAAATVLSSAFRQLGTALRPYLQDFAAQALVVGGAMTRSWDLIGPAFEDGLSRAADGADSALRGLKVSVAANMADAALLGAAAYAQGKAGRSR